MKILSLTIARFPRKSKNRLITSLALSRKFDYVFRNSIRYLMFVCNVIATYLRLQYYSALTTLVLIQGRIINWLRSLLENT